MGGTILYGWVRASPKFSMIRSACCVFSTPLGGAHTIYSGIVIHGLGTPRSSLQLVNDIQTTGVMIYKPLVIIVSLIVSRFLEDVSVPSGSSELRSGCRVWFVMLLCEYEPNFPEVRCAYPWILFFGAGCGAVARRLGYEGSLLNPKKPIPSSLIGSCCQSFLWNRNNKNASVHHSFENISLGPWAKPAP